MKEPRLVTVDGAVLSAARVGDDGPAVPELDRLSPRATAQRRATFIAGRRAARAALSSLLGGEPPRVDRGDRGKPVVDVPGVEVSITHAGGWALAVAARAPVGVDLVEDEALPDALAKEAFAPGELEAWADAFEANERLGRCLAFAAKEAALKWLGVGMNIPLASVQVVPREPSAPERAGMASVRHPAGRADLPLHAWPLVDGLWAVLIGG